MMGKQYKRVCQSSSCALCSDVERAENNGGWHPPTNLRRRPFVETVFEYVMLSSDISEMDFLFLRKDVFPFVKVHWYLLCEEKKPQDDQEWQRMIQTTLSHNTRFFEKGKSRGFWRFNPSYRKNPKGDGRVWVSSSGTVAENDRSPIIDPVGLSDDEPKKPERKRKRQPSRKKQESYETGFSDEFEEEDFEVEEEEEEEEGESSDGEEEGDDEEEEEEEVYGVAPLREEKTELKEENNNGGVKQEAKNEKEAVKQEVERLRKQIAQAKKVLDSIG